MGALVHPGRCLCFSAQILQRRIGVPEEETRETFVAYLREATKCYVSPGKRKLGTLLRENKIDFH
jgi:hypothetical protein